LPVRRDRDVKAAFLETETQCKLHVRIVFDEKE
jgi:hypothetical protein